MTSYKCSKCDFSRGVKGYVTQHIKKTIACNGAELIEDIVKVVCEVCSKEFDNDQLLKIHRKICVEKKALVKFHYEDPEAVNNKIDILTNLVTSINNKCEKLENENKELKKRLDRLETGIKIQKENSKKSYELLEENNEELCIIDKYKTCIPENHEDVLINVYPKLYEKSPNWGKPLKATCLSDINERLECICGDDVKIIQSNGKEIRCKYGKVKLIYGIKSCTNDCKYKVKETKKCYCPDHFNEETEEPIE